MKLFNLLSILLLLFTNVLGHSDVWTKNQIVNKNEKIKFTLILDNVNNKSNADLINLYNDISNPLHYNYGNYLSYDDIYKIINPKNNTFEDIQLFNRQNNFEYVFYGDSFRCSGKIHDIERIFKVNMFSYKYQNKNIYRSDTNYILPNELNQVLFVDGISNYLFPPNNVKINKISKYADYRYFGKETLYDFYNISYLPKNNVSVVAWEFLDGGYIESDMDYSQYYNNVTHRNVSTLVGDNIPYDVETDLDLEMLLNYQGVNVYYGESNGWLLEGYYDMLNLSIHNKLPDIISMSYGWSEYDQCSVTTCNNVTSQQYVHQVNLNFLKLGLMGYTLVVSSGDAGSKGRTDEVCQTDRLNPDFPASSPYVTSVGATFTLQSNNTEKWSTPLCQKYGCISGNQTVPVSYDKVDWTTGGHFSAYSNATNYEYEFIQEYFNSGVYLPNSSWNKFGHGVPTVAMNGHNCPVYGVYGQQTFNDVDGTSCSAPLFAGFLAYINDFQMANGRPKIGPVQQLLYLLAYEYPKAYMKSGYGYTYCTEQMCCTVDDGFQTPPIETKWNPVYGLGQPNFGMFMTGLNNIFT